MIKFNNCLCGMRRPTVERDYEWPFRRALQWWSPRCSQISVQSLKVCLNLFFFSSSPWYLWWLQTVEDNLTPKWLCSRARKVWSTAAQMILKQATKGEILLKCKFFQGFVPEASRVKLAFKHIGILMSWGASTSNLFRITMAMRCNWLLVHNAYICKATFLQFRERLSGHAGMHDATR